MVTAQRLYKRHPAKWVTASPLWDTYLEEEQKEEQGSAQPSALVPLKFRQPAILRFASDTFMEDFLKVATTTPERLHYWRVQPETWRIPAPNPLVDLPPDDQGESDADFEDKASGNDLTPEQKDTLTQLGLVKLYQPANQRFYLVTANLVCSIPGLPDRMLDLGRGEKVSFIIRRLVKRQDAQETSYDEYAFVNDVWHFVGNKQEELEKLYPKEQQHPMFPVTYYAEVDDHKRRIFAGLIPVSNREKFITAEIKPKPESHPSPDSTPAFMAEDQASRVDELMTVLDMDVFQPWASLLQQYELCKGMISESLDEIYGSNNSNDQIITQLEDLQKALIKQRDVFQVASWYILLDLASFLQTHLSPVWKVVVGEANESNLGEINNEIYPACQLFEAFKKAVFKSSADNFSVKISEGNSAKYVPKDRLQLEQSYHEIIGGKTNPENGTSLVEVLRELNQLNVRNSLEANTAPYNPETSGWPSSFLLCGAKLQIKNQQGEHLLDQLRDTYVREKDPLTGESLPGIIKEKKAGLLRRSLIEMPLATPAYRIPLVPLSQKISQSDIAQASNNLDEDNNRFLIRCVFECPNCPPSLRQVVSEPTLKFQMASYFDPDAPVRPVRIPLPVDTTPAGLRKFAKNTMFAISDSLACQIELARKLTLGDLVLSVLPWPFHKNLPDPSSGTCRATGIDIGKLCTLSIPIITLCALILLIIMVLVLDYIFKWVPYLIFCLPLPGLKAKKKERMP
jgi:hypothetical protein